MPRQYGDIGFRDTRLTNMALLGKLVWSLVNDRDKLWVQVLSHKYLDQDSLWNANNHPNSSVTWRSIMKAVSTFRSGFNIRLASGMSSIWYSNWMGTGPLCRTLDYVHISDTQLVLRDVWENGSWRLDRLATPIPHDIRSSILNITVTNTISGQFPDCWVWSGSKEGIYKASSGYRWLLNRARSLNVTMD